MGSLISPDFLLANASRHANSTRARTRTVIGEKYAEQLMKNDDEEPAMKEKVRSEAELAPKRRDRFSQVYSRCAIGRNTVGESAGTGDSQRVTERSRRDRLRVDGNRGIWKALRVLFVADRFPVPISRRFSPSPRTSGLAARCRGSSRSFRRG